MAYSNSPHTLRRVEKILALMRERLDQKSTEPLILKTANSRKSAFRIRDALDYAKENNHERFGVLKDNFIISPRRDNHIVITMRDDNSDDNSIEVIPSHLYQNTTREVPVEIPTVEFPDAHKITEVIGYTIANKDIDRLMFPNYKDVAEKEIDKLQKWATTQGYLAIYDKQTGLTLTREHEYDRAE